MPTTSLPHSHRQSNNSPCPDQRDTPGAPLPDSVDKELRRIEELCNSLCQEPALAEMLSLQFCEVLANQCRARQRLTWLHQAGIVYLFLQAFFVAIVQWPVRWSARPLPEPWLFLLLFVIPSALLYAAKHSIKLALTSSQPPSLRITNDKA